MLSWTSFIHPVTRWFRRRRAQDILRLVPDFDELSICDLGGSRHFWEKMDGILNPKRLTILNVADDGAAESTAATTDIRVELYDGLHIPYPDKHFDVVICNSVIEHVPPRQRRGLMAEVDRVGRSYFVQTPAFGFPLEPHFFMPFMHWLPRVVSRRMAMVSTYRFLTGASKEQVNSYFDEVRLLTRREFSAYLPDAGVLTERVMGVPKSHTLYKLVRRSA